MGIMNGATIVAGILDRAISFAGDAWPLVVLIVGLFFASILFGLVRSFLKG